MRDEIEVQRNTAQLFTVTEFENLLTAVNINSFELTDEYWEQNPLYAKEYNYITGVNVYEPFEITRETILNANEEQLWALYYAGIEATKLIEPISSNLP